MSSEPPTRMTDVSSDQSRKQCFKVCLRSYPCQVEQGPSFERFKAFAKAGRLECFGLTCEATDEEIENRFDRFGATQLADYTAMKKDLEHYATLKETTELKQIVEEAFSDMDCGREFPSAIEEVNVSMLTTWALSSPTDHSEHVDGTTIVLMGHGISAGQAGSVAVTKDLGICVKNNGEIVGWPWKLYDTNDAFRENVQQHLSNVHTGAVSVFTRGFLTVKWLMDAIKTDIDQKNGQHYLVILDSCFAGEWIKLIHDKKSFIDHLKEQNVGLSIQTACGAEQTSHGAVFAWPLMKLQRLNEEELKQLTSENWQQRDENVASGLKFHDDHVLNDILCEIVKSNVQQPQYDCFGQPACNNDGGPFVVVNCVRLFSDPKFYQYCFAKWFSEDEDFRDCLLNLYEQCPFVFRAVPSNDLCDFFAYLASGSINILRAKLKKCWYKGTLRPMMLIHVKWKKVDHTVHLHFDGQENGSWPGIISGIKTADVKVRGGGANQATHYDDPKTKSPLIKRKVWDTLITNIAGKCNDWNTLITDIAGKCKDFVDNNSNLFPTNAWTTHSAWNTQVFLPIGNVYLRSRFVQLEKQLSVSKAKNDVAHAATDTSAS